MISCGKVHSRNRGGHHRNSYQGCLITKVVKSAFGRKSDVRVGVDEVTPERTILGCPLAWLALEENILQVNSE